jgi:hypothetical protein
VDSDPRGVDGYADRVVRRDERVVQVDLKGFVLLSMVE